MKLKLYIVAALILLAATFFNIKVSAQNRDQKPRKKYVQSTADNAPVKNRPLSERWINLPSAPLIIKEQNRVMLLNNISAKKAVQYQLGCVSGAHHNLKVLFQNPPVKMSLVAYDPKSDISESNIFILPENILAACNKLNAKVAVTKVRFDDGNSWDVISGKVIKSSAERAIMQKPAVSSTKPEDAAVNPAVSSDSERIVQCPGLDVDLANKLRAVFGAPLPERHCSFRIDGGFAATFDLDHNRRIKSIVVASEVPRNGNDEVKTLSYYNYLQLRSKIDSIQGLGRQLNRGVPGAVTNSRTSVTDIYEEAVIKSSQTYYFEGEKDNNPPGIIGFGIYYFHNLVGIVKDLRKIPNAFANRAQLFTVRIDNGWYFTGESDYKKGELRTRSTFRVAGPFNVVESDVHGDDGPKDAIKISFLERNRP